MPRKVTERSHLLDASSARKGGHATIDDLPYPYNQVINGMAIPINKTLEDGRRVTGWGIA